LGRRSDDQAMNTKTGRASPTTGPSGQGEADPEREFERQQPQREQAAEAPVFVSTQIRSAGMPRSASASNCRVRSCLVVDTRA
jgi:hypothetical protein